MHYKSIYDIKFDFVLTCSFSSCDLTSAGGTMLAEMLERNRTIKEI